MGAVLGVRIEKPPPLKTAPTKNRPPKTAHQKPPTKNRPFVKLMIDSPDPKDATKTLAGAVSPSTIVCSARHWEAQQGLR